METYFGPGIAAAMACGVTWLELDKTFYVPSKIVERLKLNLWWWGFILLNGALAGGLYAAADFVDVFKQKIEPWPLRAALMGVSYLALVRLKIGTFQTRQGETPAGFEAIYEGTKEAFLRRINQIVLKARNEETMALANAQSLPNLVATSRNHILNNQLLTQPRKRSLRAWVARTESDAKTTNMDRRLTLASFILSGLAEDSEAP